MKLTNKISPDKAITPSITNTLNKIITRKSEKTTEDVKNLTIKMSKKL